MRVSFLFACDEFKKVPDTIPRSMRFDDFMITGFSLLPSKTTIETPFLAQKQGFVRPDTGYHKKMLEIFQIFIATTRKKYMISGRILADSG